MKKNMFVAAAVLVVFSVHQAKAFFISDEQIKKAVNQKVAEARAQKGLQKSDANKCVQFAGNWSGTCESSNGEKHDSKLKVDQSDCSNLNFKFTLENGEQSTISASTLGGIDHEGKNAIIFNMLSAHTANWNADKTVLGLDLSILANSLFLSAPLSIKANVQVMMDGQQLVTFMQTQGLGNDTQETCKYSK